MVGWTPVLAGSHSNDPPEASAGFRPLIVPNPVPPSCIRVAGGEVFPHAIANAAVPCGAVACLVRQQKRPRIAATGGELVGPSPCALEILENLPRSLNVRLFPISANALKSAINRARHTLGLDHYRLRDIRHELISLIEPGWPDTQGMAQSAQ